MVKNEMDLLRMDERQRLCWLRANRVVLLTVGVIWIGMITWELLQQKTPWFLIVMVPILAILRLAVYKHYAKMSCS